MGEVLRPRQPCWVTQPGAGPRVGPPGGALIHRFLRAGVRTLEGVVEPTGEGTPQGSPWSPRLANRLLDERDREREPRGHRVVRYADDGHIYGRSRQAGERGRARVTRFRERRWRLRGNAAQRAVDRPWNRTFLGFPVTGGRTIRRQGSAKAVGAFNAKGRERTSRTRGRTIRQSGAELRTFIRGGWGDYGFAEGVTPRRELDKGIRRRLRRSHGKQGGRRGYRERRKRGVSRARAWNTAQSAPGPWRLSRSPARAIALPARYFAGLGLPPLVEG